MASISITEIAFQSFDENQENINFITFDAYITSFNDKVSSNWSTQEIYGRSLPLYNFKQNNRKINFSFDVPSADYDMAEQNYNKSRYLMQFMKPLSKPEKPNMKGANNLFTPPLIKITFANFINQNYDFKGDLNEGLLGVMSGFTYTPELSKGFYTVLKYYPKLFKVNIDFTVIHQGE